MKAALAVLVSLGVGLVSSAAWAGCLNLCDMTVTEAVVTPASTCVTVKVTAEDCDCGVRVTLNNQCQAKIDIVGLTLQHCGINGASEQDCTSIAASNQGSFKQKLSKSGPQDYTFDVVDPDGTHTVTFSSNVTGFDSGCALAPHPAAPGQAWLFALVGVAFGYRRSYAKAQRLA